MHIDSNRRKPAATALLLLLALVALAACGGSSRSGTVASATTSTTGGGPGDSGGRFAALRDCLQKNGVTLPKRTPGQRRPPGAGGLLGGGTGPRLPNGVTRAQFEAAMKKCGGGALGARRRLDSPAYKQALVKFATCMRENGVKLPPANTSGNGPIFNTASLNTQSSQFRAAQARCQPIISQARAQSGGFAPAGAGPPGAG